MNSRNRDLVAPIPTRSAFPEHSQKAVEREMLGPVPTRGRIRRWPALEEEGVDPLATPLHTLDELVEAVRVDQLPLTIIAHGWAGDSARVFLKGLSLLLQETDAVWLVQVNEQDADASVVPPGLEGAVTLNLTRPTDRRVYDNLVADIVFFNAREEIEANHAVGFEQRAQAIIIDGEGPKCDSGLHACNEAGIPLFVWLRGNALADHCEQFRGLTVVAGATGAPEEPEVDRIGEWLTERCVYFENRYGRRLSFRSQIREVIDQYPPRSTWNEDLILQAHKHHWPEWAVECLPGLYVPLKDLSDGGRAAFVLHLILACVPERFKRDIEGELCEGQILELKMPVETAEFIKPIAGIFEDHLGNFPYPSERSFIDGAINNALIDVVIHLETVDSEASQKVKHMREARRRRDEGFPLPHGDLTN